MWPQAIWVTLNLLGLFACIASHGKEREGKVNANIPFAVFLIESALLYWGGFFS